MTHCIHGLESFLPLNTNLGGTLQHCALWRGQSTVQGDRSALVVHSQALEPATAHCPLLGLIHPPPLVPLVIYHTNIRPATTHCVPVGLVPLIIQPRDDPFLLQLHETLMSGGWGGALICLGGGSDAINLMYQSNGGR